VVLEAFELFSNIVVVISVVVIIVVFSVSGAVVVVGKGGAVKFKVLNAPSSSTPTRRL